MTLLQGTLDLVGRLVGQLFKAVDQLEVALGRLPPVVENRWSDAAPAMGLVSEILPVTRSVVLDGRSVPVAVFHARVLLDGDEDAMADLAFQDLYAFTLAVGCGTARAVIGRDL